MLHGITAFPLKCVLDFSTADFNFILFCILTKHSTVLFKLAILHSCTQVLNECISICREEEKIFTCRNDLLLINIGSTGIALHLSL